MNSRIIAAIATFALAATAQAGGRHDHDGRGHHDRDRARVLQVEPIHERVRYTVPVEHCWDERVRYEQRVDRGGAVIAGGALGAIVGNRVSDGAGIGTVVGAIAGAAIGHELARDGDYRKIRHDIVRRCELRHEQRVERRVVAYRVTYVHRGRRDVARLAYDPGRYVEIRDIRRRG